MKRSRSPKLISRACLFAAAALLSVGAPPSARAANIFFDQNGATAGTGATGAAAWNTTNAFWVNASSPSIIVASLSGTTISGVGTAAAYTFTSADVAYFIGGTAQTLTLGTGVTLNGINDSVGETFTGNTLTLAGTAPSITVGNTKTTTISSILAGTVGLVKDGAGTLKLNGANTYTGATNLKDGVLNLDFSSSTPATNILAAAGTLSLSGGSLTLTGKASTTNSQTFASTALASGNATLTLTAAATNSLLLSLGAITRTAGATMNIVNPTGTVSATNGVVFSNAAVNGIIPWATIGGADFSGAATAGATAMTTYTALPVTAAVTTTNYSVTAAAGTLTATGALTPNALKLAPTGAYTIALGTNAMTLTSGGLLMTGANAVTISGTGVLTAGNASGTYGLIVQQWGSAALSIGAIIGNNSTNATSLTKAGTGTLTLSGINTFTGNTFVNDGTLALTSGSALTGTGIIRGNLTINPGATLDLQIANALGYTTGSKVNVLTINRGTVKTSTYATAADQGWGLSIGMTGGTLQSNAGTASATAVQYYSLGGGSSITTNASDLTSTISGRINLRESNANNQLVFNVADGVAATDLLLSAMITQSATFGIKKTGAGLMRITGQTGVTTTNTFYSGSTLISGGILSVPGDGDTVSTGYYLGQLPATAFNVVVSGTATAGASGQATITVPATAGMKVGQLVTGTGVVDGSTITALTGTVITLSNNLTAAFSGAYSTWGNLTLEGNGLLQFTATGTLAANRGVGLKGNGGFDAPSGVTMTVAGVIGGTGQLLKSNFGTVILSGTNTYAGGTSILAGNLQVSADANLGVTGGLTFDNTVRPGFATLVNNGTYTFNRSTALNSAGSIITNATFTYTNSGVISGVGGLNLSGGGITVLLGANSYTGGTSLTGTTLRVAADNNLGATSGLNFSTASTLNTTANFTFARTVALNGNATFDVNAGTALTLSGILSGTGDLIKNSTGELILSGVNTYSGTTTIGGGIITINTDTSLGATPGTATAGKLSIAAASGIRSSATLTVSANRGITLSGATGIFRAAAGSTMSYGGTFVLGGTTSTLQVGGDTTTGGTVELLATTVLPTGMNLEILSSGTLKASGLYADANTWLASGKILGTSAGALALVGNDSAAIDLTNFPLLGIGAAVDSIYTGTLTPGVSAIPGATGYYLGGGGAKLTVSTALSGANNLFLNRNTSPLDTVVLNSANTYTGTTTLFVGTLVLNQATNLSAGLFMLRAGTTLDNGSGAALTQSNNPNVVLNMGNLAGGTFTFVGTNSLNLGTSNVSVAGTSANTLALTASTLTLGSLSGSTALTKTGVGLLTISGTSTYTGELSLSNGTTTFQSTQGISIWGRTSVAAASTFDYNGTAQAMRRFATYVNGFNLTVTNGSLGLTGDALYGVNVLNNSALTSIVDLSGLTSLTFKGTYPGLEYAGHGGSAFSVGPNAASAIMDIRLSAGVNAITAGQVMLGAGAANATGQNTLVQFGTTNIFNTDRLQFGQYTAGATGTMKSGLANPLFLVRGQEGGNTRASSIFIGFVGSAARARWT